MGGFNLEKAFNKNVNKLRKDKSGTYKSVILDDELDELKLTFNNDNCVEINTKGYEYITLSLENIATLLELIEKTNIKYNHGKE